MFKKIEGNIPAGITSTIISNWIASFFVYSSSISLVAIPDFSKRLILEFSDEEKVLQYNLKTLDEAKAEIISKYGRDAFSKNRIRNAKSVEDLAEMASIIAEGNCNRQDDSDYGSIKDDIDDILGSTIDVKNNYGSYIAGEYIHSNGWSDSRIVLYNKVIQRDVSFCKSLEEAYEEVFEHEFLHAYHYALSQDKKTEEIPRRRDYSSDVVKESLAAYFEFQYCLNKHIKCDIDYDWTHNEPDKYPYAGARYIPNLLSFGQLINISLNDVDQTLRDMLPTNVFYDVKNIIIYRVKKVPIPSKSMSSESSIKTASRRFFKACQSNNFVEESGNGYLFAPDDNLGEHQNMKKVLKGDIILHIFGSKLYAVGIAQSDCYFSSNGVHSNTKAGNYIDEIYDIFSQPIDLTKFKSMSGYPIGRNQRYIKEFDFPKFTELFIEEALLFYPNDATLAVIVSLL